MIPTGKIKSTWLACFFVLCLASGQIAAKDIPDNGTEIQVTAVPKDIYLRLQNDPTDEVWRRVPEYSVILNTAPLVHESVALRYSGDEAPVTARLSVVSDGQRLYFRLRWADATKSNQTKIGLYSDAAALQFPLTRKDSSIMMGEPGAPVGLWYWRADRKGIEALVARGPGTVKIVKDESLAGDACHRFNPETGEGSWYVVVSKDLNYSHKDSVDFQRKEITLAVALWQGSAGQRDGLKRVSGWLAVDLANLGGKQ